MSKDTGFSISSAERYSLALFELSEENNLLSQIEEQSLSVLNLINQSKDFFDVGDTFSFNRNQLEFSDVDGEELDLLFEIPKHCCKWDLVQLFVLVMVLFS